MPIDSRATLDLRWELLLREEAQMYTVKKFIDKTGTACELFKGVDWEETLAKADAMRKFGYAVDILDARGHQVTESDRRFDRDHRSAV